MALLNNMKSEIAEQIGLDPKEHEVRFKEQIEKYRDAIRKRQKAKTDLDVLEETIAGGDNKLQEAKEKIEELEVKKKNLTNDLNKFDDKDDTQAIEKTYGIAVLKLWLKDAKEKLAEITETVEIKEKTEILNTILKKAKISSQIAIAESITK
ncbi:hypothetical protein SAMN05446037_100613 [Anaerovirgula multivorans]|uniref:Phage minor structural protein GP20 n=1 Tax=Anaerovirgula multivorans TaxID=312168 RepID=A0A239CKP8_9FIRM|nr:hypothetical protein [Anaerovirgula multivorans]SNS20519.1 hypothetical protein SAMN05446037_100613 [Anaerovirgula multivorans]